MSPSQPGEGGPRCVLVAGVTTNPKNVKSVLGEENVNMLFCCSDGIIRKEGQMEREREGGQVTAVNQWIQSSSLSKR